MKPAARLLLALSVSAIALHCGTEEPEGTPFSPSMSSGTQQGSGAAPTRGTGTSATSTPTTGADAAVPPSTSPPPDAGAPADAGKKKDGAAPDAGGTKPPPPPPGDPCATVTCGPNQLCVPYAHGAPLGVCVDTCDCSNCGNCGGDNSDHRWDDMQEYCGNRAASPATTTCNRPCEGAGIGCIPFGANSICWPMEGCFSK